MSAAVSFLEDEAMIKVTIIGVFGLFMLFLYCLIAAAGRAGEEWKDMDYADGESSFRKGR